MLRLILKILIAYWIAAGIVIFIVDFEPHRQIHHPELTDALNSSLALNGRLVADEFEAGRCSEMQSAVMRPGERLALASMDGSIVCGDIAEVSVQKLVQAAARNGKRMTNNHAFFQLIALPVEASSKKRFVVVLKTNYATALEMFGLLPGYTTITISFVVAMLFAFLVAVPIRRLRQAAQDIAEGKLGSRVRWGRFLAPVFGETSKDDVSRLVSDFNVMAERLESLTQAQRILLRDISHELRSPLARMGVGLGLARRELAEPSMRVHLDRIDTEAKRLNELIGQILSLSYLDTVDDQSPSVDVSLNELIRDLLPSIEYEAEQCGCVITTSMAPGCHILGDGELLRSAVENILRNAVRYVPFDGRIHVETSVTESEGKKQSMICITDNGPGIAEQELPAVLEPFYRGKNSKLRQHAGFGIGLAIAHRAVGVHGGTIQLANVPEGGLCVKMRFAMPGNSAL
jgi:two-component system sensor histidine kinase CpxA